MSDTSSAVDHLGRPRVAVTGLGVKTPAGNDIPSFWETLLAGRSMAADITSFDTTGLPVRFACQVQGFDGAFYAIRRVAPGMVRGRFGRIVNVGSATGATGSAGQANYAAAKAGLLGLTRSVARELASRNVTCNLVAPGPIATAMLEAVSDDRRADLAAMVPLARLGTPDEVGATVAFLCSEAAGYITGAAIPVDGGISMGH